MLTGERVRSCVAKQKRALSVGDVFKTFPVALLAGGLN